jgi:mRNA-degrading endonuclease toxin of MazEF toxin-antitoxin module
LLRQEDTGLKRDSLLLGGQIRTVAKERLLRKLAVLQSERMPDVETALRLYLGLME